MLTDRRSRLLAVSIVLTYVIGASVRTWLEYLLRREAAIEFPLIESVAFTLAFGAFAVVGALILANRPRHPVGWIFAGIGLTLAVIPIGNDLAGYLIATGGEPSTALLMFAWVNNWYWYPLIFSSLVLLPLLFPTGRPPTRRWWWVAIAGGAIVTVVSVVGALGEAIDGQNTEWTRPNPIGIDGLGYVEELPFMGPGFGALVLLIVAAAVSVGVRFRRSEGEERQQLKWFLAAAALLPVMMVPNTAVASIPILEDLLFPVVVALLPIAAGIAILRYRLYDIDLVISRTLVFGVLAVFITGVYVGIVVGLGSVVGGGGEPNLGLSILATGLVAVLFEPVRVRAQRWANRVVFGRRASPYQVLAGLTSRLGETAADEDVLERLATLLGEGTGAEAVVWLRIGGEFRPAASSTGVLSEGSREESDLQVPVVHEEETLGLLTLIAARGQQISPTDERLVSDVAGNVGLMLRNVRLNTELAARADELAASRRRLVAVQDEERRRLERDLHDGAQQHVVAAAMQLNMAKMVAEREGHDQVAAQLGDLVELDQQAVEQLRTIARGIYPPLLEAEGLQAAICGAARSLPISVSVEADQLPRYPQDIEAAVYFCVTETIRDALRRDADTARVILRGEEASVQVEITDVGSSRLGADTLQALTDRVGAVGGELDTTPTGVRIRLPVTERAEVGV
ncbi:hypothetical protein BH23ACT4_BH23ACT4_05160 [soil metagenome]